MRRNYHSNRSNLHLTDLGHHHQRSHDVPRQPVAARSWMRRRSAFGRNPEALGSHISRIGRPHVIMGVGLLCGQRCIPRIWTQRTVGGSWHGRSVADITLRASPAAASKAGIIGEMGCTWPLTVNERKTLSAAAIAQRETGAAVLIHPGTPSRCARWKYWTLLANAGADLSRVIMGHLDRTVFEFDALRRIAESGCYLEWDLYSGMKGSYYPLAEIDMPSDAQRLEYIKRVADAGYSDKIVIGQDIATKHRLVRYGGHGYGHILENIVPKMRRKGFSEDVIRAITVGNPARILTFA